MARKDNGLQKKTHAASGGDAMTTATNRSGATADPSGAIPDSRGINLYRADGDAAALFGHYLPRSLFHHLEPTFDRLGGLAGGRLDELAGLADHNPPTLSVRRRTGQDCNVVEKHPAYVEMERLAFSELGLAAMSPHVLCVD
eukprot:Opistho-2@359